MSKKSATAKLRVVDSRASKNPTPAEEKAAERILAYVIKRDFSGMWGIYEPGETGRPLRTQFPTSLAAVNYIKAFNSEGGAQSIAVDANGDAI